MIRIVSVVGARPQFVKAAAVSRAIAATPGLEERMVHTGQHFDAGMSDVFFDELDIAPPAHQLAIHGGSHGEMTGRMLPAIESVLIDVRPDWVLVYGDTNTTLAAALAAAKLHLPVAHVEAGLRSFNRRMPEEINRVLTDHVSALLLCPTSAAVGNLAAEGITRGVAHVGDVMYDASLFAAQQAARRSRIVEELSLVPGQYAVATVHRAENTDDRAALAEVLEYLREQAAGGEVVLPLHPRTRAAVHKHELSLQGIRVVEPLGYLDMTCLLRSARLVLTDSGGVQKEAYFHAVPCVTLRAETEWVETVACGWNRLWKGPDYLPRVAIDEYGDGNAAGRVCELLLRAVEV